MYNKKRKMESEKSKVIMEILKLDNLTWGNTYSLEWRYGENKDETGWLSSEKFKNCSDFSPCNQFSIKIVDGLNRIEIRVYDRESITDESEESVKEGGYYVHNFDIRNQNHCKDFTFVKTVVLTHHTESDRDIEWIEEELPRLTFRFLFKDFGMKPEVYYPFYKLFSSKYNFGMLILYNVFPFLTYIELIGTLSCVNSHFKNLISEHYKFRNDLILVKIPISLPDLTNNILNNYYFRKLLLNTLVSKDEEEDSYETGNNLINKMKDENLPEINSSLPQPKYLEHIDILNVDNISFRSFGSRPLLKPSIKPLLFFFTSHHQEEEEEEPRERGLVNLKTLGMNFRILCPKTLFHFISPNLYSQSNLSLQNLRCLYIDSSSRSPPDFFGIQSIDENVQVRNDRIYVPPIQPPPPPQNDNMVTGEENLINELEEDFREMMDLINTELNDNDEDEELIDINNADLLNQQQQQHEEEEEEEERRRLEDEEEEGEIESLPLWKFHLRLFLYNVISSCPHLVCITLPEHLSTTIQEYPKLMKFIEEERIPYFEKHVYCLSNRNKTRKNEDQQQQQQKQLMVDEENESDELYKNNLNKKRREFYQAGLENSIRVRLTGYTSQKEIYYAGLFFLLQFTFAGRRVRDVDVYYPAIYSSLEDRSIVPKISMIVSMNGNKKIMRDRSFRRDFGFWIYGLHRPEDGEEEDVIDEIKNDDDEEDDDDDNEDNDEVDGERKKKKTKIRRRKRMFQFYFNFKVKDVLTMREYRDEVDRKKKEKKMQLSKVLFERYFKKFHHLRIHEKFDVREVKGKIGQKERVFNFSYRKNFTLSGLRWDMYMSQRSDSEYLHCWFSSLHNRKYVVIADVDVAIEVNGKGVEKRKERRMIFEKDRGFGANKIYFPKFMWKTGTLDIQFGLKVIELWSIEDYEDRSLRKLKKDVVLFLKRLRERRVPPPLRQEQNQMMQEERDRMTDEKEGKSTAMMMNQSFKEEEEEEDGNNNDNITTTLYPNDNLRYIEETIDLMVSRDVEHENIHFKCFGLPFKLTYYKSLGKLQRMSFYIGRNFDSDLVFLMTYKVILLNEVLDFSLEKQQQQQQQQGQLVNNDKNSFGINQPPYHLPFQVFSSRQSFWKRRGWGYSNIVLPPFKHPKEVDENLRFRIILRVERKVYTKEEYYAKSKVLCSGLSFGNESEDVVEIQVFGVDQNDININNNNIHNNYPPFCAPIQNGKEIRLFGGLRLTTEFYVNGDGNDKFVSIALNHQIVDFKINALYTVTELDSKNVVQLESSKREILFKDIAPIDYKKKLWRFHVHVKILEVRDLRIGQE